MCVAVHLMGSLPLVADIISAVAPLISVPGMADKLPSVSATPGYLPDGYRTDVLAHQVVDALGVLVH